jgi:hypothetical protein
VNFQQPILTAAEIVRLDSWAVDLAEEARGSVHDAGHGDWRIGDSRALIIHPGCWFFDFSVGKGGRGAVALIQFLHDVGEDEARKIARQWLANHPGEGRLAHELDDDEDAQRSADDAQRTAKIETLWEHRLPIGGTTAETYLASRGLTSPCDSLGWLPTVRGSEGAMIAEVKDPLGKLAAIQLTYLTADGAKSALKPQRVTWRGPHDWASRGLVWLSPYNGSGEVVVCEGVEDGLSLVEAEAVNVAAILGFGRLGRILWPWGVRKLKIARDDDAPGSSADNALYRGVVRQYGEGLVVHVMPRARTKAPAAAGRIKDANDLLLHDFGALQDWLSANTPAAGPEDLGPEARNAVLDEVSRLPNEQYERARKAVTSLLGFGRVKALDDARIARIAERKAAQKDDEAPEEIWPDPVTDLAEVLDAAAIEIARYVRAPASSIDAVVLWCASAHILQRDDLRIIISPRLAIQSPVPNCGKTTLLECVKEVTPRSEMVSSTSMSGLFRETHARKPTWLFDEFDLTIQSATPEHLAILNSGHRKTSAFVIRTSKTEDGRFVSERFSTFTAMAFSGTRKLPDATISRSILIVLQRASADDNIEHLIDGSSDKLVEIRRKLARWAQEVMDLPMVDRPRELCNRLGDNWYVIRRIAKAASEPWYQRAMAAALNPAKAADTNVALALLDAIWRVFDETKSTRILTDKLLSELHSMDEGRWKEEHHGKPITSYFLRDTLGDMVPANAEEIAPRRWREGAADKQGGYHVLHFADAFERYLRKGLPGAGVGKGDGPERTARENDQKHPAHPAHPAQQPDSEGSSNTYTGRDGGRDGEQPSRPEFDEGQSAAPEGRGRDPAQASRPPSRPEKPEQTQATPGVGRDGRDGRDEKGAFRAPPSGEGIQLDGAVERRPRKGKSTLAQTLARDPLKTRGGRKSGLKP